MPDYCVSACTLAFIGGRERLVMEGARLGFHAPFEEGLFNQTFAGDSSAERATYLNAGISPDFVDHVFRVQPEDIWTPDTGRLMSAHVATGVVDRYRFPDSNLDGVASKAGARAALLRSFPLARALDEWKPQAVDVLAGWYFEAYRQGVSEGKVVDTLTSFLGETASLAMAGADDDTLVGLGHFVEAAMAASKSDEVCTALGASASLADATAVLNQSDANAETLAIALLSRALARRVDVPPASHPMPGLRPIAASDALHSCAEMRALYARALSRPQHEAATLMRAFVAHPAHDAPLAQSSIGTAIH